MKNSIRLMLLFIAVLVTLVTSDELAPETMKQNASIVVKDDLGNTTSHLQFFTHDSTIHYEFSTDIPSCVIQFAPELPSYLVFSKSSGQLITTSDASPMEATVFTVACESGAGSTEVTIEVQACSGDNTYTSTMDSSSATVVLKRQSVLREFVLTPDTRSVCFPSDAFEMTMTCSRPPCVVGFATSDNLLLVHETISDFQPVTVPFDPHTSDSVVLGEVPDSYYLVPDESFTFSVPIKGPFFPVTFNPPLPQGVSWNPYSQLFVAQLAQGIYSFAMTVSNRKGSVTKELTLNVGTCRADYEQMGLHARSRNYDSLTIRNDANMLVFSESLTIATSDFTLCLPRGEYLVNVTRTMKSYLEEDYDINFTDNGGDVIETILRTKNTPQILKRITVGDFVPFGSSLRFAQSASMEPAWVEKKFKDKSWAEKTPGNWGSFTTAAPVAYFRKQFSLGDVSAVSIVHVAIRARGEAIVYLNGKEISRSTLSELTTRRTTLSASFLSKGTNVVCVQLQDAPATTIDFDLSVHLSRALSLPRRYSGVASDEPKQKQAEMDAAKAFDEDTTKQWLSAAIPATLTYVFTVPHRSWINRVQFRTTERMANTLAVDFTIEGLVVNRRGNATEIVRAEELGRVVDANFGYLRYVYNFDFVPTRTYDGFRFVVHMVLN